MKLTYLDKFGEWLLNLRIVELASERNGKKQKIQDLSDTLNFHLIKLCIFQQSSYRNHWKDEIVEYLRKINGFYWGRKKFERDDYYEWLFVDWFYMNKIEIDIKKVNRVLKKIKSQYLDEVNFSISENEIISIIESFYQNSSVFLEQKTFDYDKVEELIDEKFDLK